MDTNTKRLGKKVIRLIAASIICMGMTQMFHRSNPVEQAVITLCIFFILGLLYVAIQIIYWRIGKHRLAKEYAAYGKTAPR